MANRRGIIPLHITMGAVGVAMLASGVALPTAFASNDEPVAVGTPAGGWVSIHAAFLRPNEAVSLDEIEVETSEVEQGVHEGDISLIRLDESPEQLTARCDRTSISAPRFSVSARGPPRS